MALSIQRIGVVSAGQVARPAAASQQAIPTGTGGAHPVVTTSPGHDVRTPQPSVRLIDSVDDPSVAAIPPGTHPVPADVLAGLEDAQRVLIVSHSRPPPDGDAVGSVLGLGRALRALGKNVDLCIDEDLPGKLRELDPNDELKRPGELTDTDYDLVVMVDVGQVERIGDARELVLAAPSVMVIDHHDNEVTRDTLGLADDVPLVTWVQPSSPAAAMQIADVVAKFGDVTAECALPLAAGILTDTGFFKYENVQLSHVQRFKGLLPALGGDMTVVTDKLKYQLPETAVDFLAASTAITIDGPAAVVALSADVVERAVALARREDAKANRNDVIAQVKYGTLVELKNEHPVGVMLVEEDGRVAVEVRSREAGPALALAQHLGGGGHPRAAGAGPGGTLDEVRARIAEWARAWERR